MDSVFSHFVIEWGQVDNYMQSFCENIKINVNLIEFSFFYMQNHNNRRLSLLYIVR